MTAAELPPDALSIAHRLADAARAATLPHFRNAALGVADKGDGLRYDPVTVADEAAEDAMRAILDRDRPDDAILGEERGHSDGSTGLTWVLDPIDGTRAFMAGIPTWGVLIALDAGEGPVLGVIDQPHIGERFTGMGDLAEVTGPRGAVPLRSRGDRPLSEAVLSSTFPEIGTEDERAAFAEVAGRARLTRYGLDCYAYALLAAGHIDLVIEAGLAPYDIAAPIAVIEAAGGIVTDWQGGPASAGGRVVAAASRQQHDAALEHLSRAGKA